MSVIKIPNDIVSGKERQEDIQGIEFCKNSACLYTQKYLPAIF